MDRAKRGRQRISESKMIGLGVIGYGYWGPNVARNFHGVEGSRVVAVCDRCTPSLRRAKEAFPNARLTSSSEEVVSSKDIDAIAVVTPVWSHYQLAKMALLSGKHVFVEKPFTSTSAEAEELIEIAQQRNLTIMVDHTFLFTGTVRRIRQLIKEGTLGKLYYYDSMRVNLGLFQHDINVVWDLAPHDLSILDYLIGTQPETVVATGESHLNGVEDVAFITLYFPANVIAHVNVNWLSPVKVRTTLIGGEKRMLVWNDLEVDEKIKIYDKGVMMKSQKDVYGLLVSYRSGDMWAPRIEQNEALRTEAAYFIECVTNQKTPFNDGVAGLRIVRMLEAADQSIKQKGKAQAL